MEHVGVEVDPARPAQGSRHLVDGHHGEVPVIPHARQVADESRTDVEISDETTRAPHSQRVLTKVLDVNDPGRP